MNSINIRYIVKSVDDAIAFYAHFGFSVDMHPAPGFAALSKNNVSLFLNEPGVGGAGQPMADGTMPSPGGWNRFQLVVDNLDALVSKLRKQQVKFRNDVVTGQGGRQVLVEDPSGNLIELFEPKLQA